MRFSNNFLDEIRARLPVSHVVGRRVDLKKRGREFVGLSPFNSEKTPSFTVNDAKGFYHCFSSGNHGDIFRFLVETEGVSFPEAVERLANEAGVPMPKRDPDADRREKERDGLHDVMAAAQQFFVDQLHTAGGAKARGYLADRGLSASALERFGIGFAPNSRNALREHLTAKGFSKEAMVTTGLLIHGDDIPVAYDRFRDRVMFPITDLRRRVIAFGGRALSPDAPAKYLNSPETPLFRKGHILYNLANARQAAHDGNPIIVAEGYMDVIALAMAGFAGAVAPLGTALTEDQIGLLWRITDEPLLCFDGDKAGVKAAFRSLDIALPRLMPGKSLRYALLPEGQDPDDLLKAEGPAAIEKVLSGAKPLLDMLWSRETENQDWSTPEKRAAIEAQLGQLVCQIGDETIRKHYGQMLRARFESQTARDGPVPYRGRETTRGSSQTRKQGWGRQTRQRSIRPTLSTIRSGRVTSGGKRISEREAVILAGAIRHPALIESYLEDFAALEFAAPELTDLRDMLIGLVSEATDGQALEEEIHIRGRSPAFQKVDDRVKGAGERCYQWLSSETPLQDVELAWLQLVTAHTRNVTLVRELRDAEKALGDTPSDETLARVIDLKAQLQSAAGIEALGEGDELASSGSGRRF
ncbi:MAG: DNA primase [Pseudomonadota bacterium]